MDSVYFSALVSTTTMPTTTKTAIHFNDHGNKFV